MLCQNKLKRNQPHKTLDSIVYYYFHVVFDKMVIWLDYSNAVGESADKMFRKFFFSIFPPLLKGLKNANIYYGTTKYSFDGIFNFIWLIFISHVMIEFY